MTIAAASRHDHPATLFATPEIVAERRADGSILLRSATLLQPSARCVGDWLEHWARQTPERIFLGERSSVDAPWTTLTYKEALRLVRSAAAWILAQGLSAERPLVVLSDNSIDHALLALSAMHVGVPIAAISPAYSLMSKDFEKLKSMIGLLDPGVIYVSSQKPFAPALAAIKPLHSARIVHGEADSEDTISFRSVAATPETSAVAKAFSAITPDSIAKFLLTSGSTGTPKAVINTQRMLTSSQQAKAQIWPFLESANRPGAPRLAAMEPHLRRQSQFQSGAAQRWHVVHRRRQAGAGPVRDLARQSAQRDADGVLQRGARLRHADIGTARR